MPTKSQESSRPSPWRAASGRPGARSWVGSSTEITDYLQLLFAGIGQAQCPKCGLPLQSATPDTITQWLMEVSAGAKLMICFETTPLPGETASDFASRQAALGFIRAVVGCQIMPIAEWTANRPDAPANRLQHSTIQPPDRLTVVVDRLVTGEFDAVRARESFATALNFGGGSCSVFVEQLADSATSDAGEPVTIDGNGWRRVDFQRDLRCLRCGVELPPREPRLFDSDSGVGACPTCEGFGDVQEFDMSLIVPDPTKSLRQGAIAPWNSPGYSHELDELLALADDYGLPTDVPFSQLEQPHLDLICAGSGSANSAGSMDSSLGCNGESTRCTSASFSIVGGDIGVVPPVKVGGCAPKHWRLRLPAATLLSCASWMRRA